ncbi:Pth2 protein [Candida orthopsilosis Co 90-125]|uniref:peptidyl-tRNA hydrolase n=1 Tax=Candida orthopsilosis (strain 90-125) TaxID=1136231 RepID=H8WW55_CANO9|nr:Pth2 protein [Candida orthopsilosis Co 90-125]CCG20679.1 Pth2 protein [Candida orthopsilosis Co 90-125]
MSNFGIAILSISVLSFVTGFYTSQFFQSSSSRASKWPQSFDLAARRHQDETDEEDEKEEEDLDINSLALNDIPGEVRMTLVVRQDLKMGKGKAAAQCSHATLSLYKKITNPNSDAYNPQMVRRWEYGNGQAKITLQVPNQEEMDMLYAQAISLGINACIIHDAGRTQIAAGSATVLGLGPAPKKVLDQITGELKLY